MATAKTTKTTTRKTAAKTTAATTGTTTTDSTTNQELAAAVTALTELTTSLTSQVDALTNEVAELRANATTSNNATNVTDTSDFVSRAQICTVLRQIGVREHILSQARLK